MPPTFFRLDTDGKRTPVNLDGVFAGPVPSACWVIGGGPSLNLLPTDEIAQSPLPKMCLNRAGTGLLRPTFWTAYDPSERFDRSVYLDPGVMKLLPRRRAMDFVPGTSFKVCECPQTFFFERDGRRGYSDFLHSANRGIVDWADSLVQAIDVLYRLGFRVLYLAGCEMRIGPSPSQRRRAAEVGVVYSPQELLRDFVERLERAGLFIDELEALGPVPAYHFGGEKPLRAAANTDAHYFRIAQCLRLSRRSLSSAGMQLISVTPYSRLNDDFPYVPVRRILERVERTAREAQTLRRYGPPGDVQPPGRAVDDVHRRMLPHGDAIEGELLVEREGLECVSPFALRKGVLSRSESRQC